MATPPRDIVAGGIYHVTSHSVVEIPLFRSPDAFGLFLRLVKKAVEKHGWLLHAFSLMTNHYHLLLETPEPTLARGMQWLNGFYAQIFNQEQGRRGRVMMGPYASKLVETDEHFLACVRYIALNPCLAGLCRKPEHWRWSSYAATVKLAPPVDFLTTTRVLAAFHQKPAAARRHLRELVDGTLAELSLSDMAHPKGGFMVRNR